MFSIDQLLQGFTSHLRTKGALLSAEEQAAQIEGLREGAELLASFMAEYKPMAHWTPQDIIRLLQAVHAKTAEALLRGRKEKAGCFREDDAYVLRNPLLSAGYDHPNQFGRIAKFLASYTGPTDAVDFLVGYFKTLILDHPKCSPEEVEKFKIGISAFASNYHVPFDAARLAPPCSENEQKALDKVYKTFPPSREIPTKIKEWAIQLLKDLETRRDPREIFAVYYRKFIDIHPFIDANSRTVLIFLNAILLEQGYAPLFLHGPDARRVTDHYFNQGTPSEEALIRYVKERIPTPAYRLLREPTQTTLFLQFVTDAHFASFLKTAETDRIAVVAAFKATSHAEQETVVSKLEKTSIPYSIEEGTIRVPDVNLPEVATKIQNAFYSWRDSQAALAKALSFN